MTLSEIASHVCEIVGTTDADSVALCKTFVQRRYSLIWDAHPWRETLDVMRGYTTLYFRDVVFTERQDAERILAVCWEDERQLAPADTVNLWMSDPAAFSSGGSIGSFTHLRRTAATKGNDWLEDANSQFGLLVRTTSTAVLTLKGLPFEGVETTVETTSPGSLAWAAIPQYWREIHSATVSSEFDDFIEVAPVDVPGTNILLSVVTAGQTTTFPTFLQIRLSQKADANNRVVRAIFKQKCQTLADGDTPLLPNVTEALINFAQADMLERQRQYSKAQVKKTEGAGLVQMLVDLQRRQTADGSQIIPCIEPDAYAPIGQASKGYW
jgi:hypothetical protein